MHLQALRADLLHHALHGRVDAADGVMIGFEIRGQHAVAGLLDGAHHAVRADHDQAIDRMQRDGRFAQIAAAVGRHRFHDVADKGAILHAARRKAGRFVAAPDDDIGGLFDFFHFVAVDDLFVAGEVDDPRALVRAASGRWRRGRRCRVLRRQAARFPWRAFRWACRSGPSGSRARRASAERRDRTIRPSRERWWRAGPFRDPPRRR